MRKRVIGGLCLLAALGVAGVAQAATDNTQTMSVTVSPSKVPKSKYANVQLKNVTTTGSTATGAFAITPVVKAQIFYDKDIKFDTQGVKQCNASLEGTTTAVALQKCGNAKIGAGQAKVKIGGNPALPDTIGKITAFNSKPKGGKPVILLHVRVDAIASTQILTATLNKTNGKYGWRLDVKVPPLPAGTAVTVFQVNINHKPVVTKKTKTIRRNGRTVRKTIRTTHYYVAAKCSHANRKWSYKGTFFYRSDPLDPTPNSGSLSATAQQSCQVR
ncbi:MAG: hypothetical protein U0R52_14090 [Solirubrobacterales bacterium]